MAFTAEMQTSRVRAKLTGYMADLKNFLNTIDTSSFCSYILTDSSAISSTCIDYSR